MKVTFEAFRNEPIDIMIGEYKVQNRGLDLEYIEIKHLEIED